MQKHYQVGFYNKKLVPINNRSVETDGERYVEFDIFASSDLAFTPEITVEAMKDIFLNENNIIPLSILKKSEVCHIPCIVELHEVDVEVSELIVKERDLTDIKSPNYTISIRLKDYEFKKINDLLDDLKHVDYNSISDLFITVRRRCVVYKDATWFLNSESTEK